MDDDSVPVRTIEARIDEPEILEPGVDAIVRGAAPDLDARDPEYIRNMLPLMWLMTTVYFRAEVNGMDRIPEEDRCCSSPTIPAGT